MQSILQQGDTEKIIKIITILSIIRAKYFYDQKIIIGFTLLPLLVLCEGEEDLVPTLGCGKETAKSQGSVTLPSSIYTCAYHELIIGTRYMEASPIEFLSREVGLMLDNRI